MVYGKFIETNSDYPSTLAKELLFLARATGEVLSYPAMEFILIEPSQDQSTSPTPPDGKPFTPRYRGVGCDSRRLHIIDPLYESADAAGLRPGLWKMIRKGGHYAQLAKIESIIPDFPNYRKTIPEGDPSCTVDFEAIKKYRNEIIGGAASKSYALLMRALPTPEPINLEYLFALGCPGDIGASPSSYWAVSYYKKGGAIKFTAGRATAFIMPMIAE